MRTHYRNGDEIGLLCGCDGCNPIMISGILCHEAGCPFAWKDKQVSCFECGYEFYPDTKYQQVCWDCNNGVDFQVQPEPERKPRTMIERVSAMDRKRQQVKENQNA